MGTLTGTTHTHATPTHIMLRKVLAFAEGAVKKVLASLEKCRHLLKELLKSVSKLTYDIYIYIYIYIYIRGGG